MSLTVLWKDDLVDDHIVGVDLELGQLLHQALRLVQGQELGDADADEGGQVGVLELRVHLLDHGLRVTLPVEGLGLTPMCPTAIGLYLCTFISFCRSQLCSAPAGEAHASPCFTIG